MRSESVGEVKNGNSVAGGKDSSGVFNVVVLNPNDNNFPYLVQQDLTGNWAAATKLPNLTNLSFSAVAAEEAANGELELILVDQRNGLPYLIRLVPSGPPALPALLTVTGQGLPTGKSYSPIATCIDRNGNLVVLLRDTIGEIVVVSQNSSNIWQYVGIFGFAQSLAPGSTYLSNGFAAGLGNDWLRVVGVASNTGPGGGDGWFWSTPPSE